MNRFNLVLAFAVCLLAQQSARAETPGEVIESFSSQDNGGAWVTSRRYMRRMDDQAWKTRMIAMHKLVAAGEDTVPALVEALNSKDDHTRIFAAQTLGYLAPHAPRERLLELAKSDPNAAVRLYAVDALGMQGGDPTPELALLQKAERNRDVVKHIGYALERKAQGVADDVVDALAAWDPATIDSAVVGKPAPEFELATPDGQTVRLSDFRGKRMVVLVFVYGDT